MKTVEIDVYAVVTIVVLIFAIARCLEEGAGCSLEHGVPHRALR